MRIDNRYTRVVVFVLFAVSSVQAVGALTTSGPTELNLADRTQPIDQNGGVADPAPSDNITVITTQGADWRGYSAEILAIDGDGQLVYSNGTYGTYFDVDPSPTGRADVTYIASTDWEGNQCGMVDTNKCSDNRIERVNLSTGEVTRLYSEVTPNHQHSRWHDVDRINASHYVVAGIEHDRVFILNITSGEKVWTWHANESYPGPSQSGGPADDWTHLNDVEVLPDGRIMISPRNHDQVAFLHRNGTLDADWTIGSDEDHSVMFEQHNPDYIPESMGGPAVVIADSENNRLVEYQRENGEWVESWQWTDSQLDWPRDADRLPNGHTLVTDSLGDRVLELNRRGEVVWSVSVGIPYESERLGTGDESQGGPAAEKAGLWSQTESGSIPAVLPPKIRHGVIWMLPKGLSFSAAMWSLATMLTGLPLLVSVSRETFDGGLKDVFSWGSEE